MSVEMVVLRAEPVREGDSVKTILVEHDMYAEDKTPQNYFTPQYKDAVEVGVVQMIGDTDQLDRMYISEM